MSNMEKRYRNKIIIIIIIIKFVSWLQVLPLLTLLPVSQDQSNWNV